MSNCNNCIYAKLIEKNLYYCKIRHLLGTLQLGCNDYTPKINLKNRFAQVTWYFDGFSYFDE